MSKKSFFRSYDHLANKWEYKRWVVWLFSTLGILALLASLMLFFYYTDAPAYKGDKCDYISNSGACIESPSLDDESGYMHS